MPRPTKVMRSYRLPVQLIERLDRAETAMNVAKVDIIVEALEMYLDIVERKQMKERQS